MFLSSEQEQIASDETNIIYLFTVINPPPTRCGRQQDGQRILTSEINNRQSSIVNQFPLGLPKIERFAARCGRQQDGQRIPVGRRSIFRNPHAARLATFLQFHGDYRMVRLPHPTPTAHDHRSPRIPWMRNGLMIVD